ncbi:hypothetical protein PVK06_004311 [Gossypium arboreum]|uniref:Uncharacterized protein n=1 Tax=Gossypium arboreum TaxID=29729 RepID=A0ABR0QRY1_GOSAR|nr:hypothetical protein PVK06_004311 [Gossypium arboreum]
MKVDSKEMPISLFWGEKLESSSQNEDFMYKDMEDFLFKMLGKEFQLERDVILQDLAVDASAKGDQDQANKLLEQVTYICVP